MKMKESEKFGYFLYGVIDGRTSLDFGNFVDFLLKRKKIHLLPSILRAYRRVVLKKRERFEVVSFTEPTEEIISLVKRVVGREVLPKWRQDKNLVAGLRIIFGDKLVDLSARRKLDEFKEILRV